MSTDLDYISFSEQYAKLTDKMKKRFMRKPNITELVNEFVALAIQCENADQPSFAGQCYLCAAKCEATAGNFLAEAEQYVAAARQFFLAESTLTSLKFRRAEEENIEAAIGSFMFAYNKYPEGSAMRTSVLMELAENLEHIHRWRESIPYYEQALTTLNENTVKILCIRKLHNLYMDDGKYNLALETANKISECGPRIVEDLLFELQISRILLTLYLQPPEENMTESQKQLLSDLKNCNDNDSLPFNQDLRLKLQTIILHAGNTTEHSCSLVRACEDIKCHLTEQQWDIIIKLVKEEE